MTAQARIRMYLTGVGGQGTLTATTLLARTALDHGLEVSSGEIHGMAQRGGVVESTILLGGWKSPKIGHGEADIMLGFEPLESLRGLPYLRKDAVVFSNTESIPPPGVSAGRKHYPPLADIEKAIRSCAKQVWFMPCNTLGLQAGNAQCGNSVLLGALCASGLLPFGLDALHKAIEKYLPPKLVESNQKAIQLGAAQL